MIFGKAIREANYFVPKFNVLKKNSETLILRRSIFSSPEDGKQNFKELKKSKTLNHSYSGPKFPTGAYFMLVIPVSTLCLGVWQVYRWKWKLELIDTMERKVYSDVSEFPHHETRELEDMEYRKVRVRGHFDYSNEALIGPRSLLQSGDSQPKGLISRNSGSGYHVVTPFKLSDHNMTIMVNRGWIPNRKLYQFKSIADKVEIIGVVRLNEKRSPFVGRSISQRGLWLSRDIPSLAEYLGTQEIYLDLHSIEGIAPDSMVVKMTPIPGQTRITLRNEHVSYFTTWFSLSAITSYMWHRRFILRKPLL